MPTYGHTPGHQSFVVELDESVGGDGFVFAFDAADLTENIEHELRDRWLHRGGPEETIEPIRRLKRLASEKGYRLIPGHDPARVAGADGALSRTVRAVVDLVIRAERAVIDGQLRPAAVAVADGVIRRSGPIGADYPAAEQIRLAGTAVLLAGLRRHARAHQ